MRLINVAFAFALAQCVTDINAVPLQIYKNMGASTLDSLNDDGEGEADIMVGDQLPKILERAKKFDVELLQFLNGEEPSKEDKEDPKEAKADPPKKAKEDPKKAKEDPPTDGSLLEDPEDEDAKEDPKKAKEDPKKAKEDPSTDGSLLEDPEDEDAKEDPKKAKEDPKKAKEDPPTDGSFLEDPEDEDAKEDPKKAKEDPKKAKEDPKKAKEDPPTDGSFLEDPEDENAKEDPKKAKEDPKKAKEDPPTDGSDLEQPGADDEFLTSNSTANHTLEAHSSNSTDPTEGSDKGISLKGSAKDEPEKLFKEKHLEAFLSDSATNSTANVTVQELWGVPGTDYVALNRTDPNKYITSNDCGNMDPGTDAHNDCIKGMIPDPDLEGCNCPGIIDALMNGKNVFVSQGKGSIDMPSCCQQKVLDTNITSFTNQTVDYKYTPGIACEKLSSCSDCTILRWCAWSSASSQCMDQTHVPVKQINQYSKTCAPSEPAEIFDEMSVPSNFHPTVSNKTQFSQSPSIIHEQGWPQQFNGFLPPAGCGGSLLQGQDIVKPHGCEEAGMGGYPWVAPEHF